MEILEEIAEERIQECLDDEGLSLDLSDLELTKIPAILLNYAKTLNQHLRVLALYGNEISDLSALGKLSQLTKLYLSGNQIHDISAIAKLNQLTRLELGNNQISDISALAKLSQLTFLDLSDNQIIDINALTTLYLSDNQISDISPLKPLINKGMLEKIQIEHNPVWQKTNFILDIDTNSNHIEQIKLYFEKYADDVIRANVRIPQKVLLLGNQYGSVEHKNLYHRY